MPRSVAVTAVSLLFALQSLGCATAPKLIVGQTVALYSPEHKRFVRMYNDGFVAAPERVGDPKELPASWLGERFLIVDAGGGNIALYNQTLRRFLRLNARGEADAAAPVDALPAEWRWERFTPVDAGSGELAFYNGAHHRFLRMKPDGLCDSAHQVAGPEALPDRWKWERFKVLVVEPPPSVSRALPPQTAAPQ